MEQIEQTAGVPDVDPTLETGPFVDKTTLKVGDVVRFPRAGMWANERYRGSPEARSDVERRIHEIDIEMIFAGPCVVYIGDDSRPLVLVRSGDLSEIAAEAREARLAEDAARAALQAAKNLVASAERTLSAAESTDERATETLVRFLASQ